MSALHGGLAQESRLKYSRAKGPANGMAEGKEAGEASDGASKDHRAISNRSGSRTFASRELAHARHEDELSQMRPERGFICSTSK